MWWMGPLPDALDRCAQTIVVRALVAQVSAALCTLALVMMGTVGLDVSPAAAAPEKRVALVIGNGAYVNTSALANPLNDARDMSAALKSTGFDVIEALDADKRKLDGALRSFTDQLTGADVALFFYAGHGLQVGSQNYLVPTDAKLERERDLEFEAVRLDFVLRQMEIDREGKTTIVILDACRDNPLARNLARSMGTRSAGIGRGLAAAATGLGTFIAYSTQPGNVALDGEGRNSPFTAALAKHIRAKGRNLPATMIEVRKDVVAATGGRQVPWDHSALTGDFYFVPDDAAPQAGKVAEAPAGTSADVAALQERLAKLEREAKERERSTGAAGGAAAGVLPQADAMRLAELRARAASVEELTKDLQRKLFDARRAEGQAPNDTDRIKLQRDSINIQMEWTRRGLDLRKLKDEIAALEGRAAGAVATAAPPAPPAPPVIAKSAPQRTSPSFEEADNVGLVGAQIRAFRAPNPIACREQCEADLACAAFQHGKKAANMGQCQLFSEVKARQEDQSWRSGVRTAPAVAQPAAAVTAPAALPTTPSWQKLGFDVYEGLEIMGEVIKRTNVDSAAGCLNVCRNTARCVASLVDATGAGKVLRCTALGSYSGPSAKPGFTAIVRSTAR